MSVIYGTVDTTGHFDAIQRGAAIPAGAYPVTAADALMMQKSGYTFQSYKPDGSGGVTLDTSLSQPIDLKNAKADAKKAIGVAFAGAVALGLKVTQGFTMQSDWTDGAKIKASYDMAILGGATATTAAVVRDMGNTTHNVTVGDLQSIAAQIGQNYLRLLQKKWGYVDQIDAATSPAAATVVVWA